MTPCHPRSVLPLKTRSGILWLGAFSKPPFAPAVPYHPRLSRAVLQFISPELGCETSGRARSHLPRVSAHVCHTDLAHGKQQLISEGQEYICPGDAVQPLASPSGGRWGWEGKESTEGEASPAPGLRSPRGEGGSGGNGHRSRPGTWMDFQWSHSSFVSGQAGRTNRYTVEDQTGSSYPWECCVQNTGGPVLHRFPQSPGGNQDQRRGPTPAAGVRVQQETPPGSRGSVQRHIYVPTTDLQDRASRQRWLGGGRTQEAGGGPGTGLHPGPPAPPWTALLSLC